MICYFTICVIYQIICSAPIFYRIACQIFSEGQYNLLLSMHVLIMLISFWVLFFFSFVMINFVRYHIALLVFNVTTIESLEMQKKNQTDLSISPFNVGKQDNFYQVFGIKPLYWFIPLYTAQSQPTADGIIWSKQVMQLQPQR